MTTVQNVSVQAMPKKSGNAIAAQAKAQLAAQKAQLESQRKALKEQEQALKSATKQTKAELKSDRAFYKAEELAAMGNSPYMVENIYKGPYEDWLDNAKHFKGLEAALALAGIAQSAIKADKAQKALTKAQEAVQKIQVPTTPEYKAGNEIIQTDLPQTHADVFNLIADGLTGDLKGKGKSQKVIIHPCPIDLAKLSKVQTKALESLITNGYVVMESDGLYTFTDKGLNVVGLTWDDVQANYLNTLK